MTNSEFENAIRESISEHIEEYISEDEIDNTPHDFSSEFETKMKKLIDSLGKPKHISRKKMIACIVAAIIAACAASMSVSAVREAFINFITNIFDTHTNVQVVEDNNAPFDFAYKYEVTADMSDYEFIGINEYISKREYVFENEHCTLYFTQYIKEYYDVAVNTEGYEMEELFVNGKEGFYIDMYNHNAKSITWNNGDYVLSVYATYDEGYNLDKTSMLTIANSVQKAE